jgi:hypothetical protein
MVFFLILTSQKVEAGLVLNEFKASNQGGIRDEDGEASDWIEIYNSGEEAVAISGYGISDDPEQPLKWTFPEMEIPPQSFLLLWASDKNRKGKELHTNFGLKKNGESLLFSNPDGTPIDRIDFGPQFENQSFGRTPNGGEWRNLDPPTPGKANEALDRSSSMGSLIFSMEGGFFDEALTLEITSPNPQSEIYYTIDCSTPTRRSIRLEGPITLHRTTIIRAREFIDSGSPSSVFTHTYFLAPRGNLPTLSLVIAPQDLSDASQSLFENLRERGEEWERNASLEFFDEGVRDFGINCGCRIHGGISRSFEKNSFRLYFSHEYGSERLDYPLFPDEPVKTFKRLVLSSGSNDTITDNREIHSAVWTLIRDALMNELFREAGVRSIGQRPVKLYLNGNPWGIYWVKERIDKYFVEDHFGYNDFDLLKHEHGVEAKEGDLDKWEELSNFLKTHPLHLENNYRWVSRQIDLDAFITHHVLEMWAENVDWPHNNHYQLRPRIPGGKWDWIPWDSDVVLGSPYVVFADYNMYDHVSGNHRLHADWSTLHFRSLLANREFRDRFVRRAEDLISTILHPERVEEKVANLASQLRADIDFETDRWGSSPEEWEKNVIQLNRFVRLRDAAFRVHTEEFKEESNDHAKWGSAGILLEFAEERSHGRTPERLFDFTLRQSR